MHAAAVGGRKLHGDIVRGLMLRQPDINLVRVQDVGLAGVEDPEVLEWAAENDRILLTHDRATMPDFAYERLAAGGMISGMFILGDRLSIALAIEELLLMNACSEHAEWSGRVVYLLL